MRRALRMSWIVVVFSGVLAPLSAQDLEETFCENDPMCSEDNLSIVFTDSTSNVLEYNDFAAGMTANAKATPFDSESGYTLSSSQWYLGPRCGSKA